MRTRMPSSWLLLDSQATCDIFSNSTYLQNIHHVNTELVISTNTGVRWTNLQGTLPGYGPVWYYEDGIANILSLHQVRQRYRVSYDSTENGRCFLVHKPNGSMISFQPSVRGLHYYDMSKPRPQSPGCCPDSNHQRKNDEGPSTGGAIFINTIEDNKHHYHPRDMKCAEQARQLQKIIGRPSLAQFIRIVENNLLPNCPVMRADILTAEKIFGKEVGCLKGKTISSCLTPLEASETVPPSIPKHYQQVVLTADIMKVNGIPFLITLLTKLKFATMQQMNAQDGHVLLAALHRINTLYATRDFRIVEFRADGEFACISDHLPPNMTPNICSADEHVPEIECFIRVVKECCRATFNTLPFMLIPSRMTIEMVYHAVFWLNAFPATEGISMTLSPCEIMTGL